MVRARPPRSRRLCAGSRDDRKRVGAGRVGSRDLVAHQASHRPAQLSLHTGRADAAEARLGLDRHEREAGHRLQQPPAGGALTTARVVLHVVVQGHALPDLAGEGQARQLLDQELGGLAERERQREVLDLVVEVDAGRAPHDDLAWREALEELQRPAAHAGGGLGVALPVVDDPAAVAGTAHRDVVQPEPGEDRGHRLHHVRGAQDVAAEVKDDVVVLTARRRWRGPPATLVAPAHEVLRQRDLAEVRAVVVAHRGSTARVASIA